MMNVRKLVSNDAISLHVFHLCQNKEMLFTGLSVDGDLQGVERLYGALSAHMWPGMVLKSGETISQPSFPENEGLFLILIFAAFC